MSRTFSQHHTVGWRVGAGTNRLYAREFDDSRNNTAVTDIIYRRHFVINELMNFFAQTGFTALYLTRAQDLPIPDPSLCNDCFVPFRPGDPSYTLIKKRLTAGSLLGTGISVQMGPKTCFLTDLTIRLYAWNKQTNYLNLTIASGVQYSIGR